MDELFLLLFLGSIICFIVGLINPKVFSRFIKGDISRKKIALIFGLSTIAFFVLFGMTTDASTPAQTKTTETNSEQDGQAEKTSVTTDNNKEVVEIESNQEAVKKQKEESITNTSAPSIPTEYKSALNKATTYANTMDMSKKGVYDQLVSEYGEKFSAEAAQYAVDNVKADWNANALAKAKTYQDKMDMSPAAVRDQLTSEFGEKFTQSEADYAIQHLND